MRDNKGRFITGHSLKFDTQFKKGFIPWNKNKKGCVNSGSFQKGHKHSEMALQKIKRKMMGRPSPMKGKKHTKKSKEKNRLSHLGKATMKGKAHWNWKGGITPLRKILYFSDTYKKWREAVFKRDNYTCVICGVLGKELNADHIKPWSKYKDLRFSIDNGRTLCIPCHRETETWGIRGGGSYR